MLRKYLSFSRFNATETCVSPIFLTTSLKFKSSLSTKKPQLIAHSAKKKKPILIAKSKKIVVAVPKKVAAVAVAPKKEQQKTTTATPSPSSQHQKTENNPLKTFKLSLDQIKLLSSTFLQLGGTYKARGQGSDFFRGTAMIRVSEKLDVFRTQTLASLKTPEMAAKVSFSVHDLNQLVLKLNDTSSILKRVLDFAKEHNQTTSIVSDDAAEPKGNVKKVQQQQEQERKVTLLIDDDVPLKKLRTTSSSSTKEDNNNNNNPSVRLSDELNLIKTEFPQVVSSQFISSVLGFGVKAATGISNVVLDKDCAHYFANVLRASNGKIDNITTFRKVLNIWAMYPTVMDRVLIERYGYRRLFPLTPSQKLGLKYYEDLAERIPRAEVAEHEKILKAAGAKSGLSVQICGSYRRERPTCGDVDCIVWSKLHKTDLELNQMLSQFLKSLDENDSPTSSSTTKKTTTNKKKNNNYIIETFAEGDKKFMGMCKLPAENDEGVARKVRRLDIRIVPRELVPTMVLYFTGSASHNVHMRQIAISKGMLLNEYGLFKLPSTSSESGGGNAVDTNLHHGNNSNINNNNKKRIPVSSEEDVFKALGMKFVEPKDRE